MVGGKLIADINLFQSPFGVLGVCRLEPNRQGQSGWCLVSVPFRGFRGLQDGLTTAQAVQFASTFQSPSGVLGVCREHDRGIPRTVADRVSVPFRGFRGLQGSIHTGI